MRFRSLFISLLAVLGIVGIVDAAVNSGQNPIAPYLNISGTNQIDGVSINPNTAGAGNFTTLAASSTVSGNGFSTYLAAPPAIGGTTPAAGTFTTLTANTLANDAALQLNSLEAPLLPGGRLSLSSTVPVPTSDQAAATTIYYLPYQNQLVPIYNGTHWIESNIGNSGTSFGLGSTNMPTSQVYDIYITNVSGTPTMCSMYWGGNTSRSSSAGGKSGTGNATITQKNGVWVNNAALSASDCFGGASGTTGVAAGINQATLLGTYYTSANGQTQVICNPTAASGGAAVGVYLSNAYNRVPLTCSNSDTATSQTSTSASWAKLGANDTAQFVDSLQQVSYSVDAHVVAGGSSTGVTAAFGVACAGTGTTAPTVIGANAGPTATLADNYSTISVHQNFYPILGLSNACFAEKQSPSTTSVTYMPTSTYENFSISLAY